MRTPALAFVLAFAALQTVALADCCCVVICKHRDATCDDCGHEPSPGPAPQGCCGGGDESPRPEEKKCTHIEPSSDVANDSAEASAIPVAADLLPEPSPLVPPPSDKTNRLVYPNRGSPPLYLLHSALLI